MIVATGNLKFIVLPFPLNIFILARLLGPGSLACDCGLAVAGKYGDGDNCLIGSDFISAST